MWLGIVLLAAIALEALLLLGQDRLFNTQKLAEMEAELEKTYGDLREAKKRIDDRQILLRTANIDAERQRKQIQEADKAFADAQKTMPNLIHVLGTPNPGPCFRALITKTLPANPDRSQKIVWACTNFLEVWADDAAAAKASAERQFSEKQGYKVGEMMPVVPDKPPVLQATG